MTDFTVNYAELRGAADDFDAMHGTATTQLTKLDSVGLGQPDFGRIPWLQTRVYEAYAGHTADCSESLTELTQALAAARDGLRQCAEAYEGYDNSAAEALSGFFEGVFG
ncbi:hypothetical protein SAMN02745244_01848 [Tessaracoccus bendigoensis DSM 12906]|uniref:Excreted virulence factor EspC, type VII ESX diderm n=1 Tax=Tessaracoccus bendigoensis DSM 12906 TaxID=1123357 RepID=A0A1M6H0J8_9ACTN|nr:hypothetical protein [Tessaracoccus bendigoensis]SHJ15634.1 hypothetical protein SAMN02745244_01848 [Tessaracoccus bendigoensis DSM 12906]